VSKNFLDSKELKENRGKTSESMMAFFIVIHEENKHSVMLWYKNMQDLNVFLVASKYLTLEFNKNQIQTMIT
jgi:hypothetical protein